MPAFRVSGATGQAPTTVWFGPVPDKYNILLPFYYFDNGSTHGLVLTSILSSCNFINQWVPWDANFGGGGGVNITISLGSTVTAPDGTSTAYHVIEGTNNGYHMFTAGCNDGNLRTPSRRRFAAFAKAAERTRCFLLVGENINLSGSGGHFEEGVVCVFDLAGGQIGVAPVVLGPLNFGVVGSGIIPYGNGWYLCYIDVSVATNASIVTPNTQCLQSCIGPDSGSGTGAASYKYAGNGTSGINIWRTNMLPPRAWGINTLTFSDDFNSISTIDINNTLAPGFKWYVNGNSWPSGSDPSWLTPIPPGSLTVSGSVLKVPAGGSIGPPNGINPNVTSAGYNPSVPGKVVGETFTPPFLWECSFRYDVDASNTDELAYWSIPTSSLLAVDNAAQEVDIVDSGAAGAQQTPNFAVLEHGGLNQDYILQVWQGYPIWYPQFIYGNGSGAMFNGVQYISLVSSNLNNQPDLTLGTKWAVNPPPANTPDLAHTTAYDQSAFNTYAMLRVPDRSQYAPFDDTGTVMNFMNGVACQFLQLGGNQPILNYGSAFPIFGSDTLRALTQVQDGRQFIIIFGSGTRRSIYTDSIAITQ